MISFRQIWRLLQETATEWQLNEVSLLAASLAYYTVFSLAPLLVIVMMIVGAIFGEQGAELIAEAIANMRADAEGGTFQLLFNLGFLLFGATGVFAQIQYALDRIWEVKPSPKQQLFNFLRKRLLSFVMVLAIACILLLSFVGNAVLTALVDFLNSLVPSSGYLWQILSLLISLGITTAIFALIYTVLPDVEIAWRDTLVGASVTAILFLIGQFLFGLFLSQTNFGSAYGVAGSFVIVITWIFYAAQVLLLGAEFTKVFAKQRGSAIIPSQYAVSVSNAEQQRSLKPKRLNTAFRQFRRRRPRK